MNKHFYRFWLIILIFSFSNCKITNAPLLTKSNPNIAAVVPFTFTSHNNISIPALINGTDSVNLMFHTANSHVGLIESVAKEMTSIQFGESQEAESWGGGGNTRSRDIVRTIHFKSPIFHGIPS